MVCCRKLYSSGGFLWRKKKEYNEHGFIERENLRKIGLSKEFKNIKPICQYDIKGNIVKEWSDLMAIKSKTGFDISAISRCCRGKQETSYNFVWKYIVDKETVQRIKENKRTEVQLQQQLYIDSTRP